MSVKVEVKGLKEIERSLDKLVARQKRIEQVIANSALNIATGAKKRLRDMRVKDTGHLSRSIIVDIIQGGMAAEIGSTAGYAPYVEFGTRPHFPPPDALESWARHHGFDSAWPICKAIAERGLPERPYLNPAYEEEKDKFTEKLKEALEKP